MQAGAPVIDAEVRDPVVEQCEGVRCIHQHLDALGMGRVGDLTHRPKLGAGVVLGDPDEQARDHQADEAAEVQGPAGEDLVVNLEFGAKTDGDGGDRQDVLPAGLLHPIGVDGADHACRRQAPGPEGVLLVG